MSKKLIAYHGGSGMWSVQSEDRTRTYSVRVNGRGKVTITNSRTGNILNPIGPTGREILTAMDASRKRERDMADAALGR